MPLERFITAGNSGNDKDMLTGKTKGIVVANYSPEMEELKNTGWSIFQKKYCRKEYWKVFFTTMKKYRAKYSKTIYTYIASYVFIAACFSKRILKTNRCFIY